MKISVAITGFTFGALATVSMAAPISYTITGRFDGSLAGVPTTATMTLWAVGDDADIHPIPGYPDADTHNDLIVNIQVGTSVGTVNGLNRFFVNQVVGAAGFSTNGDSGSDFLDVFHSGLSSYYYGSDFVATSASFLYVGNFQTSLGDVSFNSFTLDRLTIDVDAVPEPASMAALAMGAVAFIRRRKNSA